MPLLDLLVIAPTIWLVWYLRKKRRLTISIASGITGLCCGAVVVLRGIEAGVSWSDSLIMAGLTAILFAAAIALFLAIWRNRGGTIDGWRMPW